MGSDPFLDLPVRRLLERLASPEADAGGGSCAALTVALAAALTAMVARRSLGSWPEASGAAAQALALVARAAPLVQADAEAWRQAREALGRRPCPGGEELEQALGRAASMLGEIAEAGADVASLAAAAAALGEGDVRADAAVAATLAAAAARAAAHLVAVNLAVTEGDERLLQARACERAAAEAALQALDAGR